MVKIYWMVNTEICSNMDGDGVIIFWEDASSPRKKEHYIYSLNLFVVNVNVVTILKINC